jgi:hypothetical protein
MSSDHVPDDLNVTDDLRGGPDGGLSEWSDRQDKAGTERPDLPREGSAEADRATDAERVAERSGESGGGFSGSGATGAREPGEDATEG